MVVMLSFWQLADVHLCITRAPALKQVWQPALATLALLVLQLADCEECTAAPALLH
jgi:hypothetical protein